MTDPVVPPRPAPPLPVDPSWSQGYAGAPTAPDAATGAPRTYGLPTDPAAAAPGWQAPGWQAPGWQAPGSQVASGGQVAPAASAASAAPAWQNAAAGWQAAPAASGPTPGYGAPAGQTAWPTAPGTFAAPYTAPATAGWQPPAPARTRTLGVVALVLAVVAAVVAPIVGAVAAWIVGQSVGSQIGSGAVGPSTFRNLRILSPVRGTVLVGEIAFWSGTVFGVWAIVQGIVAIARRRGRGFGIAAVIVGAAGAILFVVLAYFLLIAGVATGAAGGVRS